MPRWLLVVIAIASVPLLIAAAIIYLIALVVGVIGLLLITWGVAIARGTYIVVVYSNSPHWQTYFERQVLPAVQGRAVVLNWSERRRWRWSLAVALFRVFGGSRNFNPLALIVRPFRWPRALRFFQPFRTRRVGEVERLTKELLAVANTL
jgi:hypothetical protein